jgi:hypothetical protein
MHPASLSDGAEARQLNDHLPETRCAQELRWWRTKSRVARAVMIKVNLAPKPRAFTLRVGSWGAIRHQPIAGVQRVSRALDQVHSVGVGGNGVDSVRVIRTGPRPSDSRVYNTLAALNEQLLNGGHLWVRCTRYPKS